jgi:hypothetical protein
MADELTVPGTADLGKAARYLEAVITWLLTAIEDITKSDLSYASDDIINRINLLAEALQKSGLDIGVLDVEARLLAAEVRYLGWYWSETAQRWCDPRGWFGHRACQECGEPLSPCVPGERGRHDRPRADDENICQRCESQDPNDLDLDNESDMLPASTEPSDDIPF